MRGQLVLIVLVLMFALASPACALEIEGGVGIGLWSDAEIALAIAVELYACADDVPVLGGESLYVFVGQIGAHVCAGPAISIGPDEYALRLGIPIWKDNDRLMCDIAIWRAISW